jgi:glyoxylase-like metal-dependent hydrolase (beta-lactamase superfamily II)
MTLLDSITRPLAAIAALAAAALLSTGSAAFSPSVLPSVPPPAPVTAQPASSDLLLELRKAHGRLQAPISVQYGGTYELEGHLRRPGETSLFEVLATASYRDGAAAWESRIGPQGTPAASLGNPERGVLAAAGVFTTPSTNWRPQSPVNGEAYEHTLGALLPSAVLERALSATADPQNPARVTLTLPSARTAIATLDPTTRTIVAIEWPRAHPRLGDVSDTIAYEGFEGRRGVLMPKSIVARAHEDGARYTLRLSMLSMPTSPDIETLNAGGTLTAPVLPKVEVASSQVAPGLWQFTHSGADSRVLVLETAEGLMVFEAPVSSEVGEEFIAAIKRALPGKPLKALAVSHYHPHYTGGVRPFVAEGCTIYTTPQVEPYVRALATSPFTRAPDRLQRSPVAPTIQVVRGRLDMQDAAGAVAMIDIGLSSQHTDEYLVFHFPRAKVLFQGDLAYVAPGGTLRVMPRGTGLDGALQAHRLEIDTLMQSWPAKDTPPLPWKTFVEAADKVARP